jgi:Na+/H+ antiporter NhaB
MLSNRPIAATFLVVIVVASVFLSDALSGRAVAAYVIPTAVAFCAITTWLLAGSSSRSRAPLAGDHDDDAKRNSTKALLKGLALLLFAVAWAAAVAAAVRGGLVPNKVDVILWSLAPTFAAIAIAMVYLVRGFGSNVEGNTE